MKVALIGAIFILAVTQGIHFTEHKVNGATAGETFVDPGAVRLAKAACVGDSKGITRQISSGVSPDSRTTKDGKNDVSVLLWALSCTNLTGAEALLNAGANPNLAVGRFRITPVYVAAAYRDSNFLRLLLEHRGNPNARTNDGEPALMQAYLVGQNYGQWQNFYALLDAGADVNYGSVASYAASVGHPSKTVDLLNRGYNNDLNELARSMYSSGIADNPMSPEYKYLTIAARILKARGVDTEEIKREIDAYNKKVGAGIVQNYNFETAHVGEAPN